MKQKKNKPNGYPLPQRTVIYNHKKSLKPIPQIGKKYHCFDDGKITFSRHYIVEVMEILGQMQFKKKYPKLFNIWIKESKNCYWLFSRTTDKFIITKPNEEYSELIEVFVRTKQGGWFSISESSLYSGKLDINGDIWDGLIKRIDDFNYTQEEKENIIKENTI